MKKTKKKNKKKQKSKIRFKAGSTAENVTRPNLNSVVYAVKPSNEVFIPNESLEDKFKSGKILSTSRTKLIFENNENIYVNKRYKVNIESEFFGMKSLLALSNIFNEKYNYLIKIKIPDLKSELIKISTKAIEQNKQYQILLYNSNSNSNSNKNSKMVFKYDKIDNKPYVIGYLMEYINKINHPPKKVTVGIKSYNDTLLCFIGFCHHYKIFHGDLLNNFIYDEENNRIIIYDPLNSGISSDDAGNYFNNLEKLFGKDKIYIEKYNVPIFTPNHLTYLDNNNKRSSWHENMKNIIKISQE